jgi:RNA polymerase sigma factor for flagellar operon FliA
MRPAIATPPGPDIAALWVCWHDGRDAAAREALICHYLPYAKMMACVVYGRRMHDEVEFDDYLQLARVGLVEAVDRFNPGQGAQFKTFAAKRVHGAVLNGLARFTEKSQQIGVRLRLRQERLGAIKEAAREGFAGFVDGGRHRPSTVDPAELFRYLAEIGIGLAVGVLLEGTGMVDADAFESGQRAPSPELSYFRKNGLRQLQMELKGLIERLPEQQQTVIGQHYVQELPFDEIASIMGVKRARISQIHRQGLLRLRELLSDGAPRCDVSW